MLLSAGHIDITPNQAMPLFGFGARKGNYTAIHDKLEVNLLAIKQDDKLVLLYAVDTLFVPIEVEDQILSVFGAEYKLSRADVWLMASHTHFAPALDSAKPNLGAINNEYYQFVLSKIIELTKQVLSRGFEEVSVKRAVATSTLNVNRRKKLWRPNGKFGLKKKTLIYPDYDGDKDPNIQLLSFINKQSEQVAMFWNYACHPVGFANKTEVSADYIGAIRADLRGAKRDLPVAFAIGFAGDLKPDVTAVANTRWLDRLGYFFQYKPLYMRMPNMKYYNRWVAKLKAEVNSGQKELSACHPVKIQTSYTKLALNEIIGNSNKELHFKKLSLADGIYFVGLSAEVLVGYKKIVEEELQGEAINIGCLAGTDIYLPTDKNIEEGGYEVEIFKELFGVEGEFKTNVEAKVRKAIALL